MSKKISEESFEEKSIHFQDVFRPTAIDNGQIQDFISSILGPLREHERISETDLQNYRITLTSSQIDNHQDPLIFSLVKSRDNPLTTMILRYGERTFALNLLRFTLRNQIQKITSSINQLSSLILDKSKLLFNQPLALTFQNQVTRHTLYSSFLMESCESLCQASEKIMSDFENINQWQNSNLIQSSLCQEFNDTENVIDQKIASRLGFNANQAEDIFSNQEQKYLQSLGLELLSITLLIQNLNMIDTKTNLVIENLKDECHKLLNFDIHNLCDLESLEIKRQSLLLAFQQINFYFQLIIDNITLFNKDTKNIPGSIITYPIQRRLIYDLQSKGIAYSHAEKAIRDLANYCDKTETKPSELISSELPKINKNLSPGTLKLLQDIWSDIQGVGKAFSEEKKSSEKKMKRVSEKLARYSSLSALFVLGCLLLNACGLKTMPSNQIPDFRPSIPFKNELNNNNNHHSSQKNNSEKDLSK